MKRDSFIHADNATGLVTAAILVLMLLCLPLALRLDDRIDRDRPMYSDLSRMTALQDKSLADSGRVVPAQLSGGESATIGSDRVRGLRRRLGGRARPRRRHGVLHHGAQRARLGVRRALQLTSRAPGMPGSARDSDAVGYSFIMESDLSCPRPRRRIPLSWRSVLHSRPVLVLGVAVSILVPALTLPKLPHVALLPVLLGLVPWIVGKYLLCPLRWRALTDAGLSRRWHMRAYAESELLGLVTPGHVGADVLAPAPAHQGRAPAR